MTISARDTAPEGVRKRRDNLFAMRRPKDLEMASAQLHNTKSGATLDAYAAVPAALKAQRRWVLWKRESRNGTDKPTKVPYKFDGTKASSTDPSTWTTYNRVMVAVDGYTGIGFVLGDGVAGVDLDHCRDPETGVIDEWAVMVIETVGSYTEVSPSGDGVHILVLADDMLPEDVTKRRGTVEFYQRDRYFTVTGNRVGDFELRRVSLQAIHAQLFPYAESEGRGTAANSRATPLALRPSPTVSDEVVVAAARKAANGADTSRLLDGDYAGYDSPSEARFALVNRLAFYTQDHDQLVRLAEGAGFDRDGDERTLRKYDIPNALRQLRETWSGPGGRIGPVMRDETTDDDGSILASDVVPTKVSWLWRGWIPLGKITIFDGNPDMGKSLVVTDIISRVTRGATMPDGSQGIEAAGAVYWTVEDDPEDTIVPRLVAAGADLTKVRIRRATKSADTEITMTIADVELLQCDIDSVGAKIVFIDPITAHLPATVHSHIDAEMRNAMTPMQRLAADTGVAMVASRHLNKAVGGEAITRGGGTMGLIGLARSGIIAGRENGDDPEMRVIAQSKHNLSRSASAMRYRTEAASDDDAPYVAWHGVSSKTADDLVAPREVVNETPLLAAMAFLEERLHHQYDGLPAKELEDEAINAENISAATLRRAKQKLGVEVFKEKGAMGGRWIWRLETRPESEPENPGPRNYKADRVKTEQTLADAIAEAEAEIVS